MADLAPAPAPGTTAEREAMRIARDALESYFNHTSEWGHYCYRDGWDPTESERRADEIIAALRAVPAADDRYTEAMNLVAQIDPLSYKGGATLIERLRYIAAVPAERGQATDAELQDYDCPQCGTWPHDSDCPVNIAQRVRQHIKKQEYRRIGYESGIADAAKLVDDDAGIHTSPWLVDHILALIPWGASVAASPEGEPSDAAIAAARAVAVEPGILESWEDTMRRRLRAAYAVDRVRAASAPPEPTRGDEPNHLAMVGDIDLELRELAELKQDAASRRHTEGQKLKSYVSILCAKYRRALLALRAAGGPPQPNGPTDAEVDGWPDDVRGEWSRLHLLLDKATDSARLDAAYDAIPTICRALAARAARPSEGL